MTRKTDTKQPMEDKKQGKKKTDTNELEQQVGGLTLDLQRVRADFENYRKRTEADIANARHAGGDAMLIKLLPVVDLLERALRHTPDSLTKDPWVQGISGITRKLDKLMDELAITRIEATEGVEFNPELHHAVQIDEEAEGDTEVVSEELQAGYMRNGHVVRHAMVKVTRQ